MNKLFESVDDLYESGRSLVVEDTEDFVDDVITDPYDLGFTEEDLQNNLNVKFTEYGELDSAEQEDFPECDAVLYFDVYYGDSKVGETQCYGAKEDNVEEYFPQVIENLIGNTFGLDFSEIKKEEKPLGESIEYCLVLPEVKSDEEMNKVIEALKDLGYEAYSWTR